MQESKGQEAPVQRDESKEQLQERDADATSDKQLNDLEAEQQISNSKTSKRDMPAPDAEPEQPRRERDDAGPI